MSDRNGGEDPTEDLANSGIIGPEHLPTLLPHLREGVFLFGADGNLKARLSAPEGLLGYGAGAGTNVFAYLHPDDLPRGIEIGAELQDSQDGWSGTVQVRLRHADGTWRWFEVTLVNRYQDPDVSGMVVSAREVPDAPVALDEGLATLADDLPTPYVALGSDGRIRYASEAAAAMFRCRREELVGLPISELVTDRDRPAVEATRAALRTTTGARTVIVTTRQRFDARTVEAEFHTRGTDADHKLMTVVFTDHTAEPELVRLATRDGLTGLANRAKVMETLTGLLLADEPLVSVIYVDLDDLKSINDLHGHEAGDRALVAIAHRLGELVRPTDLVGRLSGDEFAIVCPGMEGTALMSLVERIGAAGDQGQEVDLGDGTIEQVTVSAGGATAVAGDTTAALLRRADEAMFEAKRRHR